MTSPNDRLRKKLDEMGAYYHARFVQMALSTINWLIKARTNRGPVAPKNLLQHQFIRVGATKYEVEQEGALRNRKTGQFLNPFAHGEYVAVKVHHKGSRRSVPVHQIIRFTLFGEKMFEGHRCLTHLDRDKKNNRPHNIILTMCGDHHGERTRPAAAYDHLHDHAPELDLNLLALPCDVFR